MNSEPCMGRDDTSARFKKTNCEMRIMNLTKSSQDSVPLNNTRVLMQKRSWWDYIFQRYRRETVDGISKMNVGFSLSRPECGWRTNLKLECRRFTTFPTKIRPGKWTSDIRFCFYWATYSPGKWTWTFMSRRIHGRTILNAGGSLASRSGF